MNYQSSNFGNEESWNENVKKGLKEEICLKIKTVFYRLLTYTSYKRARKYICIIKLSSDGKIFPSLIKKAWCTWAFLNHFREENKQLPCALFL